MNILITICARGGSKGIPGKNIKILNGKPLLNYTIQTARLFQEKFMETDIVLSTDSEEIRRVAEDSGLKTEYRRPENLAGDQVGKIDTIKDVLLWQEDKKRMKYDFILDLDVTSPLRNIDDLTEAFKIITESAEAVNLFSVSNAARSPYFNMVELKENGFYAQVKQPNNMVLSRQSAPQVYDLNASFYFYKRKFFDLNYKGAITDKSLIYNVPHICFDLDHQIDFEFLSYLLETNKLGFDL